MIIKCLGQLGQQLLEQQSTFSALNGLNVNVPNGANPNPEANDSPQISPATSSSNDPVANSVENVRKRESSTQEAKPVTNGHVGHEAGNHVLFKRRRKAVPVENGHDDLWKNEFLEVKLKTLINNIFSRSKRRSLRIKRKSSNLWKKNLRMSSLRIGKKLRSPSNPNITKRSWTRFCRWEINWIGCAMSYLHWRSLSRTVFLKLLQLLKPNCIFFWKIVNFWKPRRGSPTLI